MSTAKLLECAKAEGILLRLDGERLKWIADHQPPAMLLAEIKAHRLEIIARLTVVNASTEARDWLTRVACFLDCSPEHLLVNDWIDRHDLAEQHQHQPWLVAKQIGSDPRWRTPSEHSERACEGVSTAETDEFRAQYARAREESFANPHLSTAWIAARDAYHCHALGGCPNCYPRGNRHCCIGIELRARYDHENHALEVHNAEGEA